MSKYAIGGKSIFNKETGKVLENTIFFIGVVTTNSDVTDAHRIKVRIKGLDDHLSDSELPFVFPMLPKFVNVVPKEGESVTLFVPTTDNIYVNRMYLGPIISQPQMLNKDTFVGGSTAGLDTGFMDKRPAPSTIPEARGVYPNLEDIAIQGRDNSDIILKAKEVLLRAGQSDLRTKTGDIPKFNIVSPAYIQIKHDVVVNRDTNDTIEKGGVVNVVANKINLLTHKDGSPRFILNDQTDMISPDEMEKILADAHPLVFGDLLVTYLKMQRNAFINHVHPYTGMPPEDLSGRNDIDDYLKFDLLSLLSKNIKIN